MKQWKRNCRLIVQVAPEVEAAEDAINATTDQTFNNTRQAIDLSEMRIVFRVGQATRDNPKFAEIYVYNLSESTMNKLIGDDKAGQLVILEAGYGDQLATIFKGQAFQFRRGRESQTDTYLCILAQSGAKVYSAVVNTTFAAGTTQSQIKDKMKEEFKKCGVDAGYMCEVSDQGLPRGKSFMGMLSDFMKQFTETNNTDLVIEDDQAVMIPKGGNNGEPAFVLSRNTGMVGMPELTTEGLNVSCLLNPRLKWGGQIQVDRSSIQTQQFDINYQGQEVDQTQKSLETAAGEKNRYNIVSVSHHGDTRGNDWYTDIKAVGLGARVQITGASITAVSNGD